jgi:predicted O-methyltransferase YrrM
LVTLSEVKGRLKTRLGSFLVEAIRDDLRRETDEIVRRLRQEEGRQRRNVFAAVEQEAARSSAHFVINEMPTAQRFASRRAALEHSLSIAPETGLALEFGVYAGRSLSVIARARNGDEVYGFDSFAGLPEDWRPAFRSGAFAMDEMPTVHGAQLVKGWFDETLPKFMVGHQQPIAFVHVDSDLYASAATVFDHIGDRLMRAGGVILFDEYLNYPGWEQHEHRAWREFVERTNISFEYVGYTPTSTQVAVRLSSG